MFIKFIFIFYMERMILLRDFAGYKSENNFVEILEIISNAAKNFDILATNLSVLHNYFQ